MGIEGEPKSRVEYRRTLFGKWGLKKWTPLGDGLFEHTEEVSHAVGSKKRRLITSIRSGLGHMIVVSELRYNPEKKIHEERTITFSRDEIPNLNRIIKVGIVPRQLRVVPLETSKSSPQQEKHRS